MAVELRGVGVSIAIAQDVITVDEMGVVRIPLPWTRRRPFFIAWTISIFSTVTTTSS